MADELPKPSDLSAPFRWDTKKEESAKLLSSKDFTSEQVAEKVGVSSRALRNWKLHPEFTARIKALRVDFLAEICDEGLAVLENRVRALNDRWRRLQRVMAERGAAPDMQAIPGGTTGLMVRDVKAVNGKECELYAVDVGLLRELREHEKQAAQELGQWEERRHHSGNMVFQPITLDGDKEAVTDDEADGADGTDDGSTPAEAPPALP